MALIERDRKLMAQSSYIACSSRVAGHRRGKAMKKPRARDRGGVQERKSAEKATRPRTWRGIEERKCDICPAVRNR